MNDDTDMNDDNNSSNNNNYDMNQHQRVDETEDIDVGIETSRRQELNVSRKKMEDADANRDTDADVDMSFGGDMKNQETAENPMTTQCMLVICAYQFDNYLKNVLKNCWDGMIRFSTRRCNCLHFIVSSDFIIFVLFKG